MSETNIPEWAMEEALNLLFDTDHNEADRLTIARALFVAYQRGREDAAKAVDQVLCDWGCHPSRPSMRAEVSDAARAIREGGK